MLECDETRSGDTLGVSVSQNSAVTAVNSPMDMDMHDRSKMVTCVQRDLRCRSCAVLPECTCLPHHKGV
jgi:hypothetical protein